MLAVGVLVTLTACGTAPAKRDLSQKHQEQVDPDVNVYRAPDGFPNVTTFCIGADRVFLTTREQDSLTVLEGACE